MANPNASGTHSARPVNGSSADLTCGAGEAASVPAAPLVPVVGFAAEVVGFAAEVAGFAAEGVGFAAEGGVYGAYCA